MTTRNEWIAEAVASLAEAFNRQLSAPAIATFVNALDDIPDENLQAAFANVAKTKQFMPTPVEIREMAGLLGDKDRAVQAWSEVTAATALGPYKHVDFEDPTINAVIRNMGGWPDFLLGFDTAENEGWTRQRFLKAYESLAKSNLTGEATKALAGLSEAECVAGELRPPKPVRVCRITPDELPPTIRIDERRAPYPKGIK